MSRSEVTEEHQEIARRIGEQPGVAQVWLLVRATGTTGPANVDLLVYVRRPTPCKDAELDASFPALYAIHRRVARKSCAQPMSGGLAWAAREGKCSMTEDRGGHLIEHG